MTHAQSQLTWPTLVLVALAVVVVGTVVALLLTVSGAPLSFDITPDPASGLWTW